MTHARLRGRERVADTGLHNVSFTQSDVHQIASDKHFDGAVGRFILEFVPDPVAVLRSLSQLVRPGEVLAFHEVSYSPFSRAFRTFATLVCGRFSHA